jgi:anti-anti-sigma factor
VIEVRCKLDILGGPSLTQLVLQRAQWRVPRSDRRHERMRVLGSSGMSALLEAKQQADSMAVPIVLAGMKRIAARALQVTGLQSMFPTYPSAEEAVSALSG